MFKKGLNVNGLENKFSDFYSKREVIKSACRYDTWESLKLTEFHGH